MLERRKKKEERRKKKDNSLLLELLGFAATKNPPWWMSQSDLKLQAVPSLYKVFPLIWTEFLGKRGDERLGGAGSRACEFKDSAARRVKRGLD